MANGSRTEELRVRVRIDEAGKLQAELAGVNRQFTGTKRGAVEAASGYNTLQRSVFGLKTAIAGLGLAALGREVIQATVAQERAMTQVEAAIRSTGGAAGLTADEVGKIASELQKVTTVGDEVTLGLQAELLGFRNITRDVFGEATELALDFSERTGRGASEAARLLGKALNEPIKGVSQLAEAGVAFTAQQKEQVKVLVQQGDVLGAQRILLDELERAYGGAARAGRDSFGGSLTSLRNALGDLLEGRSGLPAAQEAIENIIDVLQDERTQAAADSFISTLLTGTASLIESLVDLKEKLSDAREEAEKNPGRTAGGGLLGALGLGIPGFLAGGPAGAAVGGLIGLGTGALAGAESADPLRGLRDDAEAIANAIAETQREIRETQDSIVIALPGRTEAQLQPMREYLTLLEQEEQRLISIAAQQQDAAAAAVKAAGDVAAAGAKASGVTGAGDIFPVLNPRGGVTFTNQAALGVGGTLQQQPAGGAGPTQRSVITNTPAPIQRTEEFQLELQKTFDKISLDSAVAGLTGLDRALAQSETHVRDLGVRFGATEEEIAEGVARVGREIEQNLQADNFVGLTEGLEKANLEIEKLSFVGPTAELQAANAEVDFLASRMEITAEQAAVLRDRNAEAFDAKQIALAERAIGQVGVAIDFNAEQAKLFGSTLEAQHAQAEADVQAYGTAIQDLLVRGYSATSDEVQNLVAGQREAKAEAAALAQEIARGAEEARRAAEETARVQENLGKLARGRTGRGFTIGVDVDSILAEVDSLLGTGGSSRSEELSRTAAELRERAGDLSGGRFGSSGNPFQTVLNQQANELRAAAERVERAAREARLAEVNAQRDSTGGGRSGVGFSGLEKRIDTTNQQLVVIAREQAGIRLATERETIETRGLRQSIATGTAAAYAAGVIAVGTRMGSGRTGWSR